MMPAIDPHRRERRRIAPLNRVPEPPLAEPDAPRLLEELVRRAESAGASDIHLQKVAGGAHVSFRLDGRMTATTEMTDPAAERVFGRIKYLARLKTYQDSLPQDGRIDRANVGGQSDIRVATYPTVTGEKIVLRLFGAGEVRGLAELGLPAEVCEGLRRFLRRGAGLLLLTGPAGSGKTTTIYGCLREVAGQGGRHVITVEDPVEQVIPGIMQTEVNEARGLTYATAARHLLRQDPQVLVIGEIRDEETANLAVGAGLTGHLVIATLHAASCRGVYERLLTMCPDHYAVWSVVELVLNQRLIRRLCRGCDGKGCEACLGSGYRGRVPVVEWLVVDEPLRRRLRAQGLDALPATAGVTSLARTLVEAGVTDAAEVERELAR